jgi:hypothetical protein
MFELDAALNQWRRDMETIWRHDAPTLAELEDHLREEFAARCRAGHAEEDAWRLAIARFGDPRSVAGEFAKVQQLSRVDRAVFGILIAVPIALIIVMGWAIVTSEAKLRSQPLLAVHVATITLGYVAGLLVAIASAYAIMRTLIRPASAAPLHHATLRVVRFWSIAVLALSCTGFILGAVWAFQAWGRAFDSRPQEIGALFVIAAFAALTVLAWRRSASTDALLALATAGGGIILAAWFGASSFASGAGALQFLGIGGLALSLALAAVALAGLNRPRPV